MDWWLPAISAGAGLAGVLIGSWLTTRREREERRQRFIQRQLEEFYAPFCALRQQIRAKGEARVRVSKASAAEWAALFEGVESPEQKQEIEACHKDQFESIVTYNNKQLADEHVPGYRKMLDLFREKLWLVERSTRIHYPTLVEFVEVWNRRVAGSLPASVAERMGHGEENLDSLYEDAERHRDATPAEAQGRWFHPMERPQGPGEEAGPRGAPVMIAAIYAHVTPRKERERLAKYLR